MARRKFRVNGEQQSLVEKYPLTMRYMGRAYKYRDVWTPETREAVLQACAEGASVVEIAIDVMGITPETFYQWLEAEGCEDFTNTIRMGYYIAKAWWLRQGRVHLSSKDFNHKLWECNMRNKYAWHGANPQENFPQLAAGGGEEDESSGVRETVDAEAIIAEAQKYDALTVEYTEVQEQPKEEVPDRLKMSKRKAKKKAKKKPPLPPGAKRKKRGKKS